MYRKTGRGEFEVGLKGLGILKARLYNFDFDDFDLSIPLKGDHILFLGQHVLPLLKGNSGQIWLEGSASRIAPSVYNKQLSVTRVGRVASFLLLAGVKSEQIQQEAIGDEEAEARGHALDDPRDRAVRMWVLPKAKNAPRPPRRVPSIPKPSQKFALAMLTGFSGSLAAKISQLAKIKFGFGLAMDVIAFVIWDTTNNLSCIYLFVGLGVGIGPTNLTFGGTTYGPWNYFTTEYEILVTQFGPGSEFESFSAPIPDPFNPFSGELFSKSWIGFACPEGVKDVYMRINTGTTLGLGLSATIGTFFVLEGPSSFYGQ